MHSDSVSTANASNNLVPMAPKDFGKKKRVNRTAKLKQCKLDARREQWLSQVKRAGGKEEVNGGAFGTAAVGNESRVTEKLEIMARREEEHEGGHMHHYSDFESPSNSPMSHHGSVLEGIDSGTNFTGSSRSSISSSGSSSSGRSGGSCSGSMSGEDEEGDDDCLDDWETVADALAATEEKQKPRDPDLDLKSAPEDKDTALVDSPSGGKMQPVQKADVLEAKPEDGVSSARAPASGRAWRPDDAFRPQSLPNLSKQYTFPSKSERYFGCGGAVWGCKDATPAPTSCPICYEDLDVTDSSFLPCSCGFKLCLFCHKRILEEDGRCPGCRKQYKYDSVKGEATLDGGSLTFRLARSCSMLTRS